MGNRNTALVRAYNLLHGAPATGPFPMADVADNGSFGHGADDSSSKTTMRLRAPSSSH